MINIYCDESCHLEHDKAKAMLLGAISCSESEKSRIYSEIRAIKERHSLSTWNEIKWTSVSPSKLSFYIEIIDYFINEPALSFRAVVAKDSNPHSSQAKKAIVNKLFEKYKTSIIRGTYRGTSKMDIFLWKLVK